MFIEYLQLHKYKRLMLSNTTTLEWSPKGNLMVILGSNGSGKAQPLDSLIKVPNGWSTMGKMTVGTEVIAKDGTVTKVNGVYPQGVKEIFKLTFADGRTAKATGDHLWNVHEGGGTYPIIPKVVTTDHIRERLNTRVSHLLWLDLTESEQNEEKKFLIDPYVLGVLLGDGSITASVTVSNSDEFIKNKVSERVGSYNQVNTRNTVNRNGEVFSIVKKTNEEFSRKRNNLRLNLEYVSDALFHYDLTYKRSWEKFIPEEYLHGSRQQRLDMINGLMDTDGYIDNESTCNYTSVSLTLAQQMQYLIRSIGGIAKITSKIPSYRSMQGEKLNGKLAYTVNIRHKTPSELFSLPRKKERANDDSQYCKTLRLRIESIESVGFEEAQCISIDHPEHLYITNDFVVTHNSSVMEELSPLPPRHIQFTKGGKKIFKCSHKGSKYVLTSVYEFGTGHHSFIKDDEELNNGHTYKIQDELCYQEFGINREIHEIAVGKIKFTNLNTAKRRELLTRMSPVDLNYAFNVYHKLRQEHRSQKGVMDLMTKRLVSENHDVPSDNEVTLLREESARLTVRLNALFSEKTNHNERTYSSIEQAQSNLDSIEYRAKELLLSHIEMPDFVNVADMEAYNELLNTVTNQRTNLEALIQRLAEELEKLKAMDKSDLDTSEEELAALENELAERELNYIKDKETLDNYLGYFPIVQLQVNSDSAYGTLENAFKQWHTLLTTFPENEDRFFSQDKAMDSADRLKAVQLELNHLNGKFIALKSRVRAIKECELIECPKCEHGFKPGVTREEHDLLVANAKLYPDQIEALEREEKTLEDYLERFNVYYTYVSRFVNLTREFPMLQPVWDKCTEDAVMFVKPSGYIMQALDWYSASKVYIQNALNTIQIENLNKRIKAIAEIDKDAMGYIKARSKEINAELVEMYGDNTVLENRRYVLTQVKQTILNKIAAMATVLKDYEQWQSDCIKYRDYLLSEAYTAEINALQINLAETTRTLSNMEQKETTIRTLENEVNNATLTHKDLSVLIKAMSPNGGLLGKYLLTFMQGVVTLVNAYINEIWTHPLQVLPSKVDKDELDYNFPIDVADGAVVTNDIAEGSESQLDIINFAFKLTILKFLGVNEMPLFLDEFGRTFDEQHRDNLIPFITNLIDNGLFRQVFFISHLATTHGAFNLAEFIVIDPSNITVPDTYNENVKIS